MKTIGVVANHNKPRAGEVVARLASRARELGLGLAGWGETAGLLVAAGVEQPTRKAPQEVDVLVALGGDGTMLRAVREFSSLGKPFLGVNIGSLGFLTSVAENDLDRALECIAKGGYFVTERSMAACRMPSRDAAEEHLALNDVVIRTGASARMITLEVSIDGEYVTSYMCDGLIIATPTGSTGHSLSAGGPILAPACPTFVISCICAHALSTRPLVVPDTCRIAVRASKASGEMVVVLDGQADRAFLPGQQVDVVKADGRVKFLHLPDYGYYGVLRQKLHWRGSSV